MEEQKQESIKPSVEAKWKGIVKAELKSGVTQDQVWPLLSDFFNAQKWLAYIETCHPVPPIKDGGGPDQSVQPGVVRYCGTAAAENGEVQWATEKLTGIDPEKKWLSYEIVENNMGFKTYSATVKLIEEKGEEEGCVIIEWWFEADPVDGLRFEEFVSMLDGTVHAMAKQMEDAIIQEVDQVGDLHCQLNGQSS